VAFTAFIGDGWTGGLNYWRNLFSALAELPGRPVTPVLFRSPETPLSALRELTPFLPEPPVLVPGWAGDAASRRRRLWHSAVLQSDHVSLQAFREQRIDVVFWHAAWYGLRFPLPMLAWIADFQHRHLPQMFSRSTRVKRDLGYFAMSRCADQMMLSSEDARRDCERFYPASRGKTFVLPFAVRLDPEVLRTDLAEVRHRYGLPDRFFYLPGQLWKHKNHLRLLEALRLLKQRGTPVLVVASGNPVDGRNPDHPQRVLALAAEPDLAESFRFLGMIPYPDLMPLMRASVAVVNPSLFEGWSTTVEEAKALGVPLVLSDLAVHREQTLGSDALFFDPNSAQAMADALAQAWTRPSVDRAPRELEAVRRYGADRARFAEGFALKVEAMSKAGSAGGSG